MVILWLVIDLEDFRAWVFFDPKEAKKKKKALINKYRRTYDDPSFYPRPHIYIRKLVL